MTSRNHPGLFDDIAGIQLQAYWNNATNATGTTGDGASLPDAVVDSDNQPSTITVDFMSSGEWGAGVGTDSGRARRDRVGELERQRQAL